MTYLTFRDIAKELQVSYCTVTLMVADGLPVVHIRGRIYRVHREALDRFLQERTRVEAPPDLNNWRRGYGAARYSPVWGYKWGYKSVPSFARPIPMSFTERYSDETAPSTQSLVTYMAENFFAIFTLFPISHNRL
jgi:excisionase family DNA binding protein